MITPGTVRVQCCACREYMDYLPVNLTLTSTPTQMWVTFHCVRCHEWTTLPILTDCDQQRRKLVELGVQHRHIKPPAELFEARSTGMPFVLPRDLDVLMTELP